MSLKTFRVKVNVPMTSQGIIKTSEHPLIIKNLDTTFSKYGALIRQIAKLTNVPEEIIRSVVYIESAGDPNAVSRAGAVGLMQVTPATATGILTVEHKAGRLSEPEKAILRKVLGARLDCILKMPHMNAKIACAPTGVVVTQADLKNPEFNLLIGTIMVGLLIDQHTENGVLRLDKLIVRYNAGYFYKPVGNTIEETLAFAKSKGGAETVGYILKFVGTNGILDLLTKRA